MKYNELENSTQVILKVVFTVVALAFLWAIKDIIILLVLSLILASAMEPLVDYLHDKKIPRVLSLLVVYIVVIGLAVLVIYLMIPPVVEEFKVLQSSLPQYSQAFHTKVGGVSLESFFQDITSSFSGTSVVRNTFGVFSGILSFIAVLVISFYLVAEEKGMKSFVSSLIPARHQDFTLSLINKIQKKMGKWVLGQIIVSFGIFIFTYIGLLLLHVHYALILALVAGLLEVVPYIGPFLSAVPALFIGFVQSPGDPSLMVWIAVLYLLVHWVEGYALVPKIMEKAVGTSPLLVIIALLIGYQLAGVVGLLISVPVSTAITVAIKEFSNGQPGE